jgi:hypothetical protein
MSNENGVLSQDTVFDLLSSARRRYILYYLRRHGGKVSINDLAAEIASWENDKPIDELTAQEEKRVYVSLYQTHVPKLESQGIVEYDSETGMITLTDRATQMDRYLTVESEQAFPWQLYYLVLAAISGVLYTLVAFDVWVFEAIPDGLTAGVIIAVFAVSAVVQFVRERYEDGDTPEELMLER